MGTIGTGLGKKGKEDIIEEGERTGWVQGTARCIVWNLRCFSYKLRNVSEPHIFNCKIP